MLEDAVSWLRIDFVLAAIWDMKLYSKGYLVVSLK